MKFQCHIFLPSQDAKQNLLLNSYFQNSCHSIIIQFIQSSSKPLVDREKRQKDGNAKI